MALTYTKCSTAAHRSQRGIRSGSLGLLARQAQARQEQFAVLGDPQAAGVRYHYRGNSVQTLNDLSGIIEFTHMSIASDQSAIRSRESRILLNREEKFGHCFIEAPTAEIRDAEI
jgi:hypothetical protein